MMTPDETSPLAGASRRQFLESIGLASTALGFAILGEAAPAHAQSQCDPPGSPGNPQAWRRDCRAVKPRRPATTLSPAEVTKLKNAYAAMRALDTSDPNDPRGFLRQANIHCFYCSHTTPGVHWNWRFFAWHRAYLYFHERILGKLIGDLDFRLPYWDWDVATHRKLPPAYTAPNASTNPLWNGTRVLQPNVDLPASDVGPSVMTAALSASDFAQFGGTANSSGIPENAPHGSVHVDVDGDMSSFDTAARDPVFYAHHSNVDKMWSDWNKATGSHLNPTDPAFLNLSWNFFDENKVWRSITAAHVLHHENQLRYTYGPSSFADKLRCLLDFTFIRVELQTSGFKLAPAAIKALTQTMEKGGEVRLHLEQVPVPVTKSAMYHLYRTAEAAKADEGPESKDFLAAFPVVLHDRKNEHERPPLTDVVAMLTREKVEALLRENGAQLAYVERGRKPEERRVTPARPKVLRFSHAEPEH